MRRCSGPTMPHLSSLLALAAAIGSASPGSAGAQSVAELPGEDRPLSPTVTDLYSVGALAGADWEIFGERVEVDFDAQGNLFVFDQDNSRVVKLGPDGEFLLEFGRSGGGPGEMQLPMGFVVTPAGEVVITDLGNQAFVVFDNDGNYLRNVPLDLAAGLPAQGSLADPAGGIVSPPGGIQIRMGGGPDPEPEMPGLPIRRFALEAGVGSEIVFRAWEPPPPEGEGTDFNLEGQGGTSIQINSMAPMEAFRPQVHLGMIPDGSLVLADTVDWTVKFLTPGGDLRLVLRRPIRPRPVTRQVREAERERRLAELEGDGGGRAGRVTMITSSGASGAGVSGDAIARMRRQQVETMVFADEVPVIADLGVDRSGTVWILRTGEEVGSDGPVDFVSPTGTYLGTASPGALSIPQAFGPAGLVAYVREDELGIRRVDVERVEGIRR